MVQGYLLVKSSELGNQYLYGMIDSPLRGVELAQVIFQSNVAAWGCDLVLGAEVYTEVQGEYGWETKRLKVDRTGVMTASEVTHATP